MSADNLETKRGQDNKDEVDEKDSSFVPVLNDDATGFPTLCGARGLEFVKERVMRTTVDRNSVAAPTILRGVAIREPLCFLPGDDLG